MYFVSVLRRSFTLQTMIHVQGFFIAKLNHTEIFGIAFCNDNRSLNLFCIKPPRLFIFASALFIFASFLFSTLLPVQINSLNLKCWRILVANHPQNWYKDSPGHASRRKGFQTNRNSHCAELQRTWTLPKCEFECKNLTFRWTISRLFPYHLVLK